jgi:hypothetical protein
MAIAAAPFGLRALGGKNLRYRRVRLAAANAAIYPGQPVYEAGSGGDACVTDTPGSQINIYGVAEEYKAANSGGWILVSEAAGGQQFAVQSNVVGTTWAIPGDVGESYGLTLSTAADTTALRSKASLTHTTTNGMFQVDGGSNVPGNDAALLSASDYPILIGHFLAAAVIGVQHVA